MRLLAKTCSSEAVEWLRTTQNATVNSSFERAFNLVDGRNRFLSIVAPESCNGPFSIVLFQFPESLDRIISVGSGAAVRKTSLTVDRVTIDFSKAKIWYPRPDWDCVLEGSSGVDKSLCDLQAILQCNASLYSLTPALFLSRCQMDNFCTKASDAAHQICHGIANSYTQDIVLGVSTIAGLGIGLTPAGDDFLVGIMHALWILYDSEEATRLSGIISRAAIPRTTMLSAAWLSVASKGHASESWHDLLEGLTNGYSNDVEGACMRILGTGSTSGADALTGFLLVMKNFTGLQKNVLRSKYVL